MSVLIKIKDMKMPSSCLNCKFTDKKFTSLGVFINCNLGLGSVVGYGTGNHVGDRHPNCPLVELPEHHGRLIDAEFLKEHLYTCATNGRPLHRMYQELDELLEAVNDIPTIIEAEGAEGANE